VLNIGNSEVESLPQGYRVIDGLFQAFAVRGGGFYVVTIANFYPSVLVLYALMMYISVYPVTMTIRSTNVYEERSLGIFADEQPKEEIDGSTPTSTLGLSSPPTNNTNFLTGLKHTLTMSHGISAHNPNKPPLTRARTLQHPPVHRDWSSTDFLRTQIRSQLGHDLWLLAIAIFLITLIETSQIHRDPIVFSVFNIIFECVSSYGCVGLSVGVPWANYSFSGAWHTGSKLVLCAVMLRGRHRGLPVAIDRAVLLPSATLGWAEEEDARRGRREGVGGTGLDRAMGLKRESGVDLGLGGVGRSRSGLGSVRSRSNLSVGIGPGEMGVITEGIGVGESPDSNEDQGSKKNDGDNMNGNGSSDMPEPGAMV
jgi:Trk-type K+ transport system membrane component